MIKLKYTFFLIFLFLSYSSHALQLGDQAPNFEAETTKGNFSFHDWAEDKWVILFSHPGDFTPVCTTELAHAAFLQPEFNKRNVKLIAISGDSIKDHLEWIPHINDFKNTIKSNNVINSIDLLKEDTDVNYPIIADIDFSISTLYGMYHPNAKPNSSSFGTTMNRENILSLIHI